MFLSSKLLFKARFKQLPKRDSTSDCVHPLNQVIHFYQQLQYLYLYTIAALTLK